MRTLILIALVVLFQGCATAYQESGLTGGYSETQLDRNVFNVSFKGNGFTSRKRVADFTLLRSAELTLENGYKYFAIIDADSHTSHSSYTTPTRSHTIGSAYAYGDYAYGSATTITTGGQTYNTTRSSSSNTIVCFEEKPESTFTYNAKFIYKKLRQKYGIKGASK
jgi:hypothetical protein